MSFRQAAEQPPGEYRPVSEVAGRRLADVYEVDPALMTEHVHQQAMPLWDTHRIVNARAEHLAWMHRHWAARTLSGAELLADLDPPPDRIADPTEPRS